MIIILYIDDLILPSNNLILLKGTKDNLLNFFETVDLGEIQYCLGIQNRTIYLNQNKYIGGILRQFGMVKNKLVWIPFLINCKFSKDMNPQNDVNLENMWVIMFQNDIGSLVYVMVCTRLDITQQWGLWINLWLILNNDIGLQRKKISIISKAQWILVCVLKKHQGCYYGQGAF